MKKWYEEEYAFTIEVTAVSHDNKTENHCRNGDEVGDIYRCTYGCPVNEQGGGFCEKAMTTLYPLLCAVRSGGDLRSLGGSAPNVMDLVCPDGVVKFRLTAEKTGGDNFHTGGFYRE